MKFHAAICSAKMLALFALASFAPPVPALAQTAATATTTLTVNFDGIKAPMGAIFVAVFDSEAAYDNGGKPVHADIVPVSGPTAAMVVRSLAAGRYAIRVFHDLDGNGKMNRNPFGIPVEPFAFSNNAPLQGRQATWAEASFEVTAEAAAATISFR
jgi:uncharacterized protein (DUF2141 family)